MKVLGVKLNLCNVLIGLLLLALLYVLTTVSCVEKFTTGNLTGADVNYRMGKGLKVSWENKNNENNKLENSLNTNVGGKVPLPEGQLYMFYKNKFDDNCCPSTYTSSTGCACISKEQSDYLNQRGGNRTLTTEY